MAKQAQGKSVRYGLMLGAAVLPMVFLLIYLGRIELAYPVLASIVAIGFAIRAYWELRGRLWFWITISLFIAEHLILILRIPWRSGWVPAPVTMAFCVFDLAIILGVISLIERWMNRIAET
jgi:uncharacterized membrane protein (DUF485 family)